MLEIISSITADILDKSKQGFQNARFVTSLKGGVEDMKQIFKEKN